MKDQIIQEALSALVSAVKEVEKEDPGARDPMPRMVSAWVDGEGLQGLVDISMDEKESGGTRQCT